MVRFLFDGASPFSFEHDGVLEFSDPFWNDSLRTNRTPRVRQPVTIRTAGGVAVPTDMETWQEGALRNREEYPASEIFAGDY